MSRLCLDTLPVEILHRIFDNLDIQSIFLSLRYVCKILYLTTNSYNRYKFNFKSKAKPYLYFICQQIPFDNVISLTLSDEDSTKGQIQSFLSSFHMERFIRLESLILREVEDVDMNKFLNYVITSSLKSLSLSTRMIHPRHDQTLSTLSLAISRATLRHLHLNLCSTDWNNLRWSTNNTLHHIRIVNSISLKDFCTILQHSPYLRKLILREISGDGYDEIKNILPFPQLTSLTFEDGHIDIVKLDHCLSLTPNLTYLKFIDNGSLQDASFDALQWEKIIRIKLSLLEKFEFFLFILTCSNYRPSKIESLINPFKSPFWIDQLKLRVTCEHIQHSNKIVLYSLPICTTRLVYHIDSEKISLSNITGTLEQTDMNYVKKLELALTKDADTITRGKNKPLNKPLFYNVTNLTIGNNGEWPIDSMEFLSTLVDLSKIVKISLSINFFPDKMLQTVPHVKNVLDHACNVRSLALYDFWAPGNYVSRITTICYIVPSTVRYLTVRVKSIEDIRYILEHLEHLNRITFEYAQILTLNCQDFIQSLSYLTRQASSWNSQCALHVWLGNTRTI